MMRKGSLIFLLGLLVGGASAQDTTKAIIRDAIRMSISELIAQDSTGKIIGSVSVDANSAVQVRGNRVKLDTIKTQDEDSEYEKDSNTVLITTSTTREPDYCSLAYLIEPSPLVRVYRSGYFQTNSITVQGSLRENSNAVPFGLPLGILGKDVLTKGLRNNTANYPFKRVKYEDELKAGITYQHYFAKPQVNFFVSYYHRNLRFANVTKDALNIAMFGNAMYEDKTADLSNVSFESVMYNQFSVGVGKTHKNLYVAANLSFLQGFSDQQLNNKQGSFYTAPYGEYIDAHYNFTYNQSSEGASSFFAPRGLGFSGDVHLSYRFNAGILQFDAQDLGFISWADQPMNYANDTSIHFEGVVNTSFLNLVTGKSGLNFDTLLRDLVSEKTHKSYKTILPSTFTLSFMHIVKAKNTQIQMTYGLQTRLLYQYYVLGYVKASVFLPRNLITSVSVSGGGYSLFNVGWDLGWYSEHYQISFGTHNLMGLVAPTAYPSASLDLRFSYRF